MAAIKPPRERGREPGRSERGRHARSRAGWLSPSCRGCLRGRQPPVITAGYWLRLNACQNCPHVPAFPVIPVPGKNWRGFTASSLFSLSKEPARVLGKQWPLLKPRTLPLPHKTHPGGGGQQTAYILSIITINYGSRHTFTSSFCI